MRKAALLLFLASTPFAAFQSASDLFERAQQLSRAGDAAGALQTYVAAVKLDPAVESWDFINSLPSTIGDRGVPLDAESDKRVRAAAPYYQEALRQFLSRHPEKYSAIFLLSQSYAFTDRLADAESLWNSYLSRHPRSVRAIFDRDRILIDEKKYDAAIAAHEQMVKFYPCDDYAKADLAAVIRDLAPNFPPDRRAALLDRAERSARDAMAMNPSSAGAMKALMDVLLEKGRAAEAETLKPQWEQLRARQKAQWNERRTWKLSVEQVSDDDPRSASYDPFRPPVYLRREPFLIVVEEPTDAPVQVSVAGDDKVPHDVSFQSKVVRGGKHVLTYNAAGIVKTATCRLYVTARRGDQSITLIAQPE